MKNVLLLFLLLFSAGTFAQYSFEGSVTISFKNGSNSSAADIKIKEYLVLIRQTENPIRKYNYFLVNLNTRSLETVSLKGTAVVIHYHLDSLLRYYEDNDLKEGYKTDYGISLRETDKAISEGNAKMVKAVGDDNVRKVTAWLVDEKVPLNEIVPLLRLLGNWNEAQSNSKKIILQADVFNKISKKETSVKANYYKEKLPDTLFDLPKNVLRKDFAQLMQNYKGKDELKVLIQTFGGF